MTIIHKFDDKGGFIAGDLASGRATYAYPTSTHAARAKRTPEIIANAMMQNANAFADSFVNGASPLPEFVTAYYARLMAELTA